MAPPDPGNFDIFLSVGQRVRGSSWICRKQDLHIV